MGGLGASVGVRLHLPSPALDFPSFILSIYQGKSRGKNFPLIFLVAGGLWCWWLVLLHRDVTSETEFVRTVGFKYQPQPSPLWDISPAWLWVVLQSWVWSCYSKTGLSCRERPPGPGLRYGSFSFPSSRWAGGPAASSGSSHWFGV